MCIRDRIQGALMRVDGKRATSALTHAARTVRIIKGLSSGDVSDEFRRLALPIAAL